MVAESPWEAEDITLSLYAIVKFGGMIAGLLATGVETRNLIDKLIRTGRITTWMIAHLTRKEFIKDWHSDQR